MTLDQLFTVPPPTAVANLVMKDGALIRLRRYGRTGRTRLVLSHGNGLAINAYAPFWLQLAQHYDVVVFDMRNHGENPLHTLERHTWENFFSDIDEIFQGIQKYFGTARTVAVVHSLAAVATLGHALRHPDRWDALCLFDPPIMPPLGHPLHEVQHRHMETLAARAIRRQMIFNSPDQLAAQFRRHPSFGHWVFDGANLLAWHTLRRLPNGQWTLCCHPAFEADVFRNNVNPTLFDRLRGIPIPLRIIASDPDAAYTTPAAAIAKSAHDLFGTDYAMVPGTKHFLQFEEPQACRDRLIDFLQRHGL